MENTLEIFFSYAHEDELLRQGLEKQLRALKRQGLITMWHDRDISAGREWEKEINNHLNVAHIILLLISPDFIDSDYCYSVEMIRAMERHKSKEAKVVPIILRPVYWQGSPFASLQVLPTDGKAVTSPTWHNQDEAFFNVAEGIREIVKESLVEQWLSNAQAHFYAGSYEQALSAYEYALHLDIESAQAYKGKGDISCKLHRYKEGLSFYEQALRFNQNDAIFYHGKGNALLGLKRYEEALVAYEQAIRLAPDDASICSQQGNALLGLKRYEEALTAYEQAIRLAPDDVPTYYFRCSVLVKLQRNEEALLAYEQANHFSSNSASTYKGKGDALYDLGRYNESLKAYEHALSLDANDFSIYNNKGNALLALQYYEGALVAYEQAIRLAPEDVLAYANKSYILEFLAQQSYIVALDLGYSGNSSARPTRTHEMWELHYLEDDAEITCLALTPNGRTLLSGSGKAIKAWDAYTGNFLRTITIEAEFIQRIAISPDGQLLVSSTEEKIKVWNISTGQLLHTLEGHLGKWWNSLVISSDGQILVGGGMMDGVLRYGLIKVWDLQTGELLRTHSPFNGPVVNIAISADKKTLVSNNGPEPLARVSSERYEGHIYICDLWTGRITHTLTNPRTSFSSMAITPDEQMVVSTSPIKLWNMQTGHLLRTFESSSGGNYSVISPNGQNLIASSLNDVYVWHLSTGKLLYTMSTKESVTCITVSSDGQTIFFGSNKTINIWRKKGTDSI